MHYKNKSIFVDSPWNFSETRMVTCCNKALFDTTTLPPLFSLYATCKLAPSPVPEKLVGVEFESTCCTSVYMFEIQVYVYYTSTGYRAIDHSTGTGTSV